LARPNQKEPQGAAKRAAISACGPKNYTYYQLLTPKRAAGAANIYRMNIL
jgi:hypothetical protein